MRAPAGRATLPNRLTWGVRRPDRARDRQRLPVPPFRIRPAARPKVHHLTSPTPKAACQAGLCRLRGPAARAVSRPGQAYPLTAAVPAADLARNLSQRHRRPTTRSPATSPHPSSQVVLQFGVSELIEGTHLAQDAPVVSIGEEAHEPPGQSVPERQPAVNGHQQVTGRRIATVLQNTRARGANPFEADVFGIPDGTKVFVTHLTTYDAKRRPIEHSRYTWPTDAVRMSDYYSYATG